MIPCPHCGETMASSALFCPHCHLAVRQNRLSKVITRLLSRPFRTPKSTSAPPVKATPNGQVTKQLQGSIQQFLRQERIITIATYTLIPLLLITITLVFGIGYLRTTTRAASSASTAIPTTLPGAAFATATAPATLAPGTGTMTPTAVASPSATAVSTPKKKPTAAPTATPQPTVTIAPQVVLAIDAGGTGGGNYQSDADYTGGKIATTTHAIDTSLVSGSASANALQSAREGTSLSGTSFTYMIGQLTPNASYTVRLGFTEIDVTNSGQRQFNVTINNQPALTNFDIIAQTGAPYKAIMQSFTTTTDPNGQITLVFSAGRVNVAIVNSIEILTTTPAA